MQRFAALLDRLALTPARLGKLTLLRDHFSATPDPDRGWALAALGGGLDLPAVRPAMLRALAEARTDPELFRLSYDYVGDLGETVALIWGDARPPAGPAPALGAVVDRLRTLSREAAPEVIAAYLDTMPAPERLALIKLATGGAEGRGVGPAGAPGAGAVGGGAGGGDRGALARARAAL